MTGKPGASGGARRNTGPKPKSYEDEQSTGVNPIEWIWQELTQRFGQEVANEIHIGFNEQKRIYEKRRRDEILERRKREQTITFPAKRRHKQSK